MTPAESAIREALHHLSNADSANELSAAKSMYVVATRSENIRTLLEQIDTLRKDAARYQVVRRMSVPQFKDAYKLNISTGKPFDEIVADLAPFFGLPHPDRE